MSETGWPAFPSHGSMGEVTHEGMTLRDYFAAKAMQMQMLWNFMQPLSIHLKTGVDDGLPWTDADISSWAYDVADAMLEERQK